MSDDRYKVKTRINGVFLSAFIKGVIILQGKIFFSIVFLFLLYVDHLFKRKLKLLCLERSEDAFSEHWEMIDAKIVTKNAYREKCGAVIIVVL